MRPARLATKGRATRRSAIGFCVAAPAALDVELPVIEKERRRRRTITTPVTTYSPPHHPPPTRSPRPAGRSPPPTPPVRPPAGRRRLPAARRRAILADDMGLGKTRQAIIALPRGRTGRSVPGGLPGRRQAQLAARDPPGRARRRRPGRRRRRATGETGTAGRSSTTTCSAGSRPQLLADALGRHRRRRGPLHQERQPAHRARAAPPRRTGSGHGSRSAEPGGRVPADGHADDAADRATCSTCSRRSATRWRPASSATPGGTAPPTTTASGWTPTARRTSKSWPRSSPGCCCDGRRTRRSTCRRRCEPGSRSRSPSKSVGSLEARALDYLDAAPGPLGPTWITFLGLLNRARHATAVAKAPPTVEAVRERVEAGEKVVVFTSYTKVVETVKEAFGAAAVSITGERLGGRAAGRRRRAPDRSRPCGCWSATSRRPAWGST